YRESLDTHNEILDSSVHKREVARTVARGIVYHEIDNAITLSWWSDLWFKTGLAALVHMKILDEIFPKWRFLDLFVVQVQQDCLRVDTNFAMKPLSYEVRTPSEIKSLFSFPIYIKGYYRVRYDYTSLKAITDYLKHKEYEKIHVINRAQIIDDTYYFFMKGEVTYDMFAYLIYYLRQERDYVAWYPMFQIFRDLSRFLPFEESEPLTKDMRFILQGLLENLTYNEKVDEDDLTKWLRREVVKWACIFGDTDCEEIAHSRLEKHLNDPTNHK
ncbi:Aminopeptidase N, partial [Ooceraea biroi]